MADRLNKMASRRERGEVVGGGFVVFRRHRDSGRVAAPHDGLPFEHPSIEAATMEAARLADRFPGRRFCVFKQVAEAICEIEETQQQKVEA